MKCPICKSKTELILENSTGIYLCINCSFSFIQEDNLTKIEFPIIMAIHEKHYNNISLGLKKIELRRKGNLSHQKIFLYITSPQKKIAGIIWVKVHQMKVQTLFECNQNNICISKKEFFNYFTGKETGYGYEILKFKSLPEPIFSKEIENWTSPQNYRKASLVEMPYLNKHHTY